MLPLALCVLFVVMLTYFLLVVHYRNTFLPGSSVNDIDISGMSAVEAEETIREFQADYELKFEPRDGKVEKITGKQIALTYRPQSSTEEVIKNQKIWSWPMYVLGNKTSELGDLYQISYDSDLLKETLQDFQMVKDSNRFPPVDAYLSDYDPQKKQVQIVPEELGKTIIFEKLYESACKAVENMDDVIVLSEEGIYEQPKVFQDDPSLLADCNALNAYLTTEIGYQFGDKKEVVDGSVLKDWITLLEDHTVVLDETKVKAYVRALAKKYNSIFTNRKLRTSYGVDVTVEGGDYGFWMDETTQYQTLLSQIQNGESGTYEPTWFQKADSFGEHDYGDSYIEVNLTAQHLFVYKDGERILESDFVSGKNDATTAGTYGITYCERYATLVGENYSSPVSYWMPFNRNIGLHDASWRNDFGGDIYKEHGSHGCVNLPIQIAKQIYSVAYQGMPVLVYTLPGTEKEETTEQTDEQIAVAINDALSEIEASGEFTKYNYGERKKKVEWVKAAYHSLSASAKEKVESPGRIKEFEKQLKSIKK